MALYNPTPQQLLLAEMYLERLKLSISGVDVPDRVGEGDFIAKY